MKNRETATPFVCTQTFRDRVIHGKAFPKQFEEQGTFAEAVNFLAKHAPDDRIMRLNLLCTWATITLAKGEDTQRYLEKLIPDASDGRMLDWIMLHDRAVSDVFEALSRKNESAGKSRKSRMQEFKDHKRMAIEALASAQEHLAAIDFRPNFVELVAITGAKQLLRAIGAFRARREHIGHSWLRRLQARGFPLDMRVTWLLTSNRYNIPGFADLLTAAQSLAEKTTAPHFTKHQPHLLYVRALYRELKNTPIGRTRKAFLIHAVQALFDKSLDKSSLEDAVQDLALAEKDDSKEKDELIAWARREGIDLERKKGILDF